MFEQVIASEFLSFSERENFESSERDMARAFATFGGTKVVAFGTFSTESTVREK